MAEKQKGAPGGAFPFCMFASEPDRDAPI